MGFIGDVVYGLTFVFVNSWGAGIITLLSCVQNIVVLLCENHNKQMPKAIAGVFILSFVIVGLSDFSSGWDIIPIATYAWFTIALYLKDISKIKLMYLLANISLATYDVMVGAYANAFEDGIEAVFLMSMVITDAIKSGKIYNGKPYVTATLKMRRLFNGVIGVKHFDLQSAIKKVLTSDTHNKEKKLTLNSVITLRPYYKYG